MGKKAQIDSDFWEDDYVTGEKGGKGLDMAERYLFLFLLTNPLSSITGVYKMSMRIMTVMTGIEKNALEIILNRFEADKKILYRENYVVIKNRMQYNKQDNPNVRTSLENALKNAPAFVREFIEFSDKERGNGLETVAKPLPNPNTNTNTNTHMNNNKNTGLDLRFNDFREILNFFKDEYFNATKKLVGKGKFLTLSKFEEEDLRTKWDQLPEKNELANAWKQYCWVLADQWAETITLKSFMKNYSSIQQKIA